MRLEALEKKLQEEGIPVEALRGSFHVATHMWSERPCELTWVRDDLLGPVGSGTKWRKWMGLLPHLQRTTPPGSSVLLKGGFDSGNLLTGVSLLKAHGWIPHIQVSGRPDWSLLPALLPQAQIHTSTPPPDLPFACVLPEGVAGVAAAQRGLFSLAFVICSLARVGHRRLWVGAGTGETAAAVVALCAWLGVDLSPHVVFLAPQSEAAFSQRVQGISALLEQDTGFSQGVAPHWTSHTPPLGKSFGARPRGILDLARATAQENALILSPLYGAKVLHTLLTSGALAGDAVLHCGYGPGCLPFPCNPNPNVR